MPKSRMTQVAEELLQQSGSDNVAWEAVEGRKYAYKTPTSSLGLTRTTSKGCPSSSWLIMG